MEQKYSQKTASFNKLDFFILSNLIFDNATKLYTKHCDTTLVPYDFITIFVDECALYNRNNDNYLKKFLLCFNNNSIPFDTIVSVFNQSKKPNYSIKKVSKDKFLSGLKAGTYIQTNRSGLKDSFDYDFETEEMKSAYNDLTEIFNELNSRKRSSSLPYKYNYIKQASNTKKKTINTKPVKTPKQSLPQKIEKLVLPKISSSTTFPKSQKLSRVDSRYFAYNFTNPASQYLLIHKYHLKKVQLSDGFLAKREQVLNSATAKKSTFDDFF